MRGMAIGHKSIKLFSICSQINGNNGEWTGTDDLAAQMVDALDELNRQLARPGVRHEDRNRRNAGRRVNGGAHRAQQDPAAVRAENVPPLPAPPPAPPEIFSHVGFYRFEGENYYFSQDGSLSLERLHNVIQPGYRVDVMEQGCGWVWTGGRGKPKVLREPSRLYSVPSFVTTALLQYEAFDQQLVVNVVETVRVKVRLTDLSPSCLRSLTNCILAACPNMTGRMLDAHVEYFVRTFKYNEYKHASYAIGLYDITTANPYDVLDEFEDADVDDNVEVGAPFRVLAQDCPLERTWEEVDDVVIRGAEEVESLVNINGEMRNVVHHGFRRRERRRSKWYKTVMFRIKGPGRFFVQYDNSDHNANLALKRMLAKTDHHEQRCANQNNYGDALARMYYDAHTFMPDMGIVQAANLRRPDHFPLPELDPHRCLVAKTIVNDIMGRVCYPTIEDFVRNVEAAKSWTYLQIYSTMADTLFPLWSRNAVAQIPHVKRALRKRFAELEGDNYFSLKDHMARLSAAVKNEFAKPGKVPRLYVAYGAGSMYANELPEFVKVCLSTKFSYYNKGEVFDVYIFSKPKMTEIESVFNSMILSLSPGHHIIAIYSDDSVYAGCFLDGSSYAYNVDISSCDSSCGNAIFFLSGIAMARFDNERAIGLLRQCSEPIKIPSSFNNDLIILQFRRLFEGSGTVLTTINNHMASWSIALSYIMGIGRLSIEEAALEVGFIVTKSPNYSREPCKLQFLKLSPMLASHGKYVMVRNYGCILRSLGSVDQDLTPKQLGLSPSEFRKTNWAQRMELFVSSVVASYVHEPGSCLMNALRERFTTPSSTLWMQEESGKEFIHDDRTPSDILDEHICARYDVSYQELEELCNQIRNLKLGDIVVSPAAARFYSVDYDL